MFPGGPGQGDGKFERFTRATDPVAVYVGELGIEKPEVWAGACLVLWVLFFPLYLRARAES